MFADMMRYGTESGKNLNDGRYFAGQHPMMGWVGNNTGTFWIFGILWLITWVLVIIVMIALARWLWKKGDKEVKK